MPRDVVRSVLFSFLLSRGVIFVLLIAGSQIRFLGKDYGGSVWRTEIVVQQERIGPELIRVAMSGDAWHYHRIATAGYERRRTASPEPSWAFFPLYPLVVRSVSNGIDVPVAALLVSNLSFLGALFAVAAAALRLGAKEDAVRRALWLLAFFPTSYFFSLPLTESLFLLLSALAFASAAHGRWWAAALFGGAASATRSVGILLLPALLLLPLQKRERFSRGQLWLALVPAGLGGFMLHLWRLTGDPLAFVKAQSLWGRGLLSAGQATRPAGLLLASPWNFVAFGVAALVLLGLATVAFVRRRQWSYAAYVFGSAALPAMTGSVQSLGRFALVVFPLFLWLGEITEKRERERALLALFTLLLGWLVALFTLRVDFAMA